MPTTLRCLVCLFLAVVAGPVIAADADTAPASQPAQVDQQTPTATDDSADQGEKPGEIAAFADQPGQVRQLKTTEGVSFNVYEAGPRGAVWGILLVPDQWGLNKHVRAWVDHLGALGYRALAVDIYNGKTVHSADKAQALATGLDQHVADAKYRAALLSLKAPGRRLATMGFGFGGAQAVQATLADPGDVVATVTYQAPPPGDTSVVKSMKAHVFSVYATQGSTIPQDQIDAFAAALRAVKRPMTLKLLAVSADPDNAPGDRFDSGIVQATWPDTEEFLKRVQAETRCCFHPKRHVWHRHYIRHYIHHYIHHRYRHHR